MKPQKIPVIAITGFIAGGNPEQLAARILQTFGDAIDKTAPRLHGENQRTTPPTLRAAPHRFGQRLF